MKSIKIEYVADNGNKVEIQTSSYDDKMITVKTSCGRSVPIEAECLKDMIQRLQFMRRNNG